MLRKVIRTAPVVSHEKRALLVDQLWQGIREAVELIELSDQKQALMVDLEKYCAVLKPVSLRHSPLPDTLGGACLE
jgi:hypothetical protein